MFSRRHRYLLMRRNHHVVVPYPATNSSVRTRALHWIDRFMDRSPSCAGSVAVHGPGFDDGTIPIGDDVLLLRNARRFTRGRHEQNLMRRAGLGVYDLDDGLPWDYGNLPGLGAWWKRPWPRSLIARRAADSCDRMIVGNQVLAEWADQHCSDVRHIPTCIEPNEYQRRSTWAIAEAPPVIGWIGSPATQGYLETIAPALRIVHQRVGALVELVGASPTALPTLSDFVTVSAWSGPEAQGQISDWDVGIMPLRDGLYERSKCGYKLLQYAAAGVPAVGSPVGVNRDLLESMTGAAPVTTDEWVDALCEVLTVPQDRRQEMATAGFAVADRYSYSAWEAEWIDAVGWLDQ